MTEKQHHDGTEKRPYSLELTKSEREAIDWVGYRYSHGDQLYEVLLNGMRDTDEWDQDGSILFRLTEAEAWTASGLIREDSLACFDYGLQHKLIEFCDRIV